MTPWTVAHQAPPSMGFFRQEYWSGLPCLPPGGLPDLGMEPTSLMSPVLAGAFFTAKATTESSSILNKRAVKTLMKKEINAFKKDLKSSFIWG